ncbi:MAG: hypothetical protein K9J13_12585 [Saprospiraceae bacterium]|nr:hypothetical protein [Saprospiraceae bacterium]
MSIKIKIIFFTFLSLFLGSLIYLSIQFISFKKSQKIDVTCLTNTLENGDLVFRKGRSIESFAVYLADKEKEFSHVGMVYVSNDKFLVIHAVPTDNHKQESVKMESLKTFLSPKNASAFAIVRPKIKSYKKQIVAQEAYKFYQNKICFDNDYDLETNDKLYCTELIIKAFKNANIDIGNNPLTQINFIMGKHSVLMPGTLLKNPFFKRIIY